MSLIRLDRHKRKGGAMNREYFLVKRYILLPAFLLLIFIVFSSANKACADNLEKTIPVTISVKVNWEMEEDRNDREGTLWLNAQNSLELDRDGSGLDHRPQLTPFSLKYRGRTFNGSIHFEETLTQKEAQPPDCSPILESYSGSRSFSYSPPEENDSINLFLRRFGIATQQIHSLATGVGAQQFLAQLQSQMNSPPDYYEFIAGGVSAWHTMPGKKREIDENGCYYVNAERQGRKATGQNR